MRTSRSALAAFTARRAVIRFAAALAGAAALLVSSSGRADDAGARLTIAVVGAGVDERAVRAALADDLGVPVVAAPEPDAIVVIRAEGPRAVRVEIHAPGAAPHARALRLPRDPALASETIVFAASNLVRDEASDLLGRLAPAASVAPPVRADPPKTEPRTPPAAPTEPPATDAVERAPPPPALRRSSSRSERTWPPTWARRPRTPNRFASSR